MYEFVLDYALKDIMDDDTFAKHVKAGIILECKEQRKRQKVALELANSELQFHRYDTITLSTVKYHWSDKNKRIKC